MTQKHHHKKDYNWLWLIINSLCAFLILFIGLFFLHYLVQMVVASVFGIQSTLYFDDIIFVSPVESWFPKLVLVSYTAPIFFSIFFAVFFYYLLSVLRRKPYLFRLYCLWGYVVSVALFFCNFVHGIFAYKSFAVILLWYKMPTQLNYVLAVLGIIGLCVVGLFLGIWFLKLAPSQTLEVHKKPRKFLFLFMLLPFLMGVAIIWSFLIKSWQNSIPLLVVPSGILIMLIFTIIRIEPIEERITLVKSLPTGKFSIFTMLVCILFLVLAKYLTIDGINL
jgi:hypothetical protein